MASLHRDAKGWRVQVAVGGKRQTVRLGGKVNERQAGIATHHIEALAAARGVGASVDPGTVRWMAGIPDRLYARLATIGLVEPRVKVESVTLGQLWDRFVAAKTVKPATVAVYSRVRALMARHFGEDRKASSITAEQAEGWTRFLADARLAPATRSKLTHVAKALFRRGVLWGLLPVNPFEGITPGPQTNSKRARYIPVADLERVLDACPSHEWRCIFALARLAGLRCPSEIAGLQWGHVDFEAARMVITSPKTEHHAEGATRSVPLSPRLQQVLMDAYTAAEPGTVYVVPRLRQPDTNLRTHAHRILARAGIEPPPKVFVNLRASAVTDWAREFGGHVAAKWAGHSPLVALRHYAQVRQDDFDRAAGKVARPVAQHGAESTGTGPQSLVGGRPESPEMQADSDPCGTMPVGAESGEWAQQDSNL